jgi:CheY-like chemotaxis protein
MPDPQPQILYVDPDESCRTLVRLLLEAEGDYELTIIGSVEEALEAISAKPFDLYIFDLPWRYPFWIDLCRRAREQNGKNPIVIFSVMPHQLDREQAFAAGADAYLVKPDDVSRLAETVRQLLDGNGSGSLH